MFRIIRVLSALDKFFRPLHGHFHWDHFTYFRHGAHELYEMRAISPELQANIQQHERITHGVAKLSQNLVNRIYGLSHGEEILYIGRRVIAALRWWLDTGLSAINSWRYGALGSALRASTRLFDQLNHTINLFKQFAILAQLPPINCFRDNQTGVSGFSNSDC